MLMQFWGICLVAFNMLLFFIALYHCVMMFGLLFTNIKKIPIYACKFLLFFTLTGACYFIISSYAEHLKFTIVPKVSSNQVPVAQ
ncbi:hypothetical protein BBN03_21040 [Vibrio parahaemolyticus]|nr:hypothetical protein BBN03_21040 [Vibrio parahaemolyticus]